MSPVNQAQLVPPPLNHGFVKLAKQGSLIPAVNYALIKVLYLFTKNKIPSVNFHRKISYIFFLFRGHIQGNRSWCLGTSCVCTLCSWSGILRGKKSVYHEILFDYKEEYNFISLGHRITFR